ncbi:hypothetical protein AWR36_010170 [Microbulbifer flavimaris]|uniref:HEPN AbiU2-like domain-containing protein n=1 Tax=Microbulbifer flavimaris TaxID=1781068 RepID=A0ABX4HZV6_9GAMM|nr:MULTISPECIES: hypothetical protein [Microbulbifer]PCO05088.1 hypothetical protein AWR36_010170 [Microbulbifer flavimaris]
MNITDQQLTRAIYSQWDFQQALSALTFLLEDCDFEEKYNKVELRRFRCYESTAIISFARPFEIARRGTTLGLRALGIKLSKSDCALRDKILDLRRKIIAHSAEEEMHYRVTTYPVIDGEFFIPHFQFNEGLHLSYSELRELETFLRWITGKMGEFFIELAQSQPELLQRYKEPESLQHAESENA